MINNEISNIDFTIILLLIIFTIIQIVIIIYYYMNLLSNTCKYLHYNKNVLN